MIDKIGTVELFILREDVFPESIYAEYDDMSKCIVLDSEYYPCQKIGLREFITGLNISKEDLLEVISSM